MIFYFTGTGNSEWVALNVAQALDDTVCRVTDALQCPETVHDLPYGEAVGFVFPVYAWGPPLPVMELLQTLRLSRYPSFLYFICTCGDDTGKTARVFCRAARERGWVCEAGYSVTMPNTYVCLPGFDVDAPEVVQRKMHEATHRLQEVIGEVRERRTGFHCHEGRMPWLKTYLLRLWFNSYLVTADRFYASEECVECGVCGRSCPLHNVKVDGRPQWGEQCCMCLSCYHHCPKQAVQYGKATKGKGQYTFRLP